MSPQKITDVRYFRQYSQEKEVPKKKKKPQQTPNQATNQCLRFNVLLFFDLLCISISLKHSQCRKIAINMTSNNNICGIYFRKVRKSKTQPSRNNTPKLQEACHLRICLSAYTITMTFASSKQIEIK